MLKNYSTKSHALLNQRISLVEEKIDNSETWQSLKKNVELYSDHDPAELAQNEDFWKEVRKSYSLHENFINLNHGSINPMPIPVADALTAYTNLSNELPGYWFFEGFQPQKEKIRQRLANLVGVSVEELSLQRNTSTAIETVIMGLPLNRGDEIILSRQDYPTLNYAWRQREQYEGIVLKWIDVPMPSTDNEKLARAYLDVLSDKTKVIQVMHLFNWNGQLMPLKEICQNLKDSSIEILGDGAHIPAHLKVNVNEMGVDYWGASLHKWLSAPIGTGILTVKKDKIQKVKPMMASEHPDSDDIRKFETIGIYNSPLEMTVHRALDYLELLGLDNKTSRLQYLKNYALHKLSEIKGVQIHTPLESEFSGALGLFSVEGISPSEVQEKLFKTYQIYTVGFEYSGINGVRISPNIYHGTRDLDKLVEAVFSISKNG